MPTAEAVPLPAKMGCRLRWATSVAALLVSLVVLLAGVGALYQWIANAQDRHANPPPGKMIDVGGFHMHLYCLGQGAPTVVLDSGLSDTWLHWYKVQPQAAQFTRVCSYDRAGLGWSDPSPRARTSHAMAEELHTLLNRAGVLSPFVHLGHSMGGLVARMHASLYPSDVVGMVLVDSVHPEQNRRVPGIGNPRLRVMLWQRRLMPFGIPRLLGWCGKETGEMQPAFRTYDCTVKQRQGWFAETDSVDMSMAEVQRTGSLGDMPLVVLSQDPDEKLAGFESRKSLHSAWEQLQEELTRLSSRGSRIVARGSGHHIHLDRPDLVIDAIRDIVTQCRKDTHGGLARSDHLLTNP